MLNFYDFEVFKNNWLVVIINPIEKIKTVIIDNQNELKDYYEKHKNEIWLGYNSKNYDSVILKSIITGYDAKKINDFIIYDGAKEYQIDKTFRHFQLYDYDVKGKRAGLKHLEGFMGNDIQESGVSFNIDRPLTKEEIQETVKYCTHDVEQTMEVFLKNKSDFDAQMNLIKTFDLPMTSISLTQAQLTATILKCKKPYDERFDEFDLQFVDTLKIEKYKNVIDWFSKNKNYSSNLEIEVAEIPHVFGWGGLHGCLEKPFCKQGYFLHIDVTSFYPSIMIRYDFLTRNCRQKEKFKEIFDTRVELKKQGKKKEQAPYKIILNSTYGICKDKHSTAYDPRQANNVCINGQLLLLDLIEHLENHCKLIQSNTDGLIIEIENTEEAFNKIDDVCYEWEKRTGMSLGFDEITEIWQGDVNNYIFRFADGKLERKGAYVKELDELDNDLPIVNESIVKFLTEGIPVEKTIKDCNDLMQFQKMVKLSSKYKYCYHNGIKLNEKYNRVFASQDIRDSFIGKQKEIGATIEKYANTPENCFIDNSDVKNKNVPLKLDKDWYIDLACDRLEKKFGVIAKVNKQMEFEL